LDELWELRLDGNGAWRRLDPPGPRPSAREEHCAIYDPVHQEMLIYGGVGIGTDYGRSQIVALHDAWALSLGESPQWRSLGAGPDRSGRWGHRAIYDPAGSRMIVSGGWGSIGSTVALATGSPPPAPAATAAARTPLSPGAPTDLPLRLAFRVVNPSRGGLEIRLELPNTASVRLELFDVAGRRVASRDLAGLAAGRTRYRWGESARLPAGIYLLRVSQAREVVKSKVILLR
jgi:hypothetical protein